MFGRAAIPNIKLVDGVGVVPRRCYNNINR
jgi:hypothetical protein